MFLEEKLQAGLDFRKTIKSGLVGLNVLYHNTYYSKIKMSHNSLKTSFRNENTKFQSVISNASVDMLVNFLCKPGKTRLSADS